MTKIFLQIFFSFYAVFLCIACSNSQNIAEANNPFSLDDIEENLFSSEQTVSSSSTSASSTSQQSESSSNKTPASSSSKQSESSSSKTPVSSSSQQSKSSSSKIPASSSNQQSESSSSKTPVSSSSQQSKSSSSKIPASSSNQQSESSSSKTPASSSYIKEYLPLDDTEYPYAGLPRIVIETEKHRQILDRETEIPARLQIYEKSAPTTEIKSLTIRGRGNSSWLYMPKKSYKIEFSEKQSILDMPQDKDWALIANYADKTLIKNYISYYFAKKIGMSFSPKCKFVELFINQEYLGVYLLTETIKVNSHRVNIPKTNNSYLVEFDEKFRKNEQIIFLIIPAYFEPPVRY